MHLVYRYIVAEKATTNKMIRNKTLSEKTADPDPFIQFDIWFREHLGSEVGIPDAVTLGTSSSDGRVSLRTVLIKGYDGSGFVFYTNYNSKKASQLALNPQAALHFYWPGSDRQIRIEGVAIKLSEEESVQYFKTRPRESQLSAWSSEQSTVIPGRLYLEKRYDSYKNRFADKQVEKPPNWGGFRFVPDWFEFWQNGEHRLHDRLTYTKKDKSWIIERLAP
jgi:pyridoxamine 5'-phosphate oxidase